MRNQITVEIVTAVARSKGVEPAEIDDVLHETVDPDAIHRLMEHESTSWTLTFEFADKSVTLSGDGEIAVGGVTRELSA